MASLPAVNPTETNLNDQSQTANDSQHWLKGIKKSGNHTVFVVIVPTSLTFPLHLVGFLFSRFWPIDIFIIEKRVMYQ